MSTATTRLRVRFKETDQMGVVHHSEYPVWLEVARIEWLRDRGLSYRELEDSGISLAVSELEVTYRAAARFDDLLEVTTMLSERSEEHTSELQSRGHLVCRLLLEKKKKKHRRQVNSTDSAK